MIGVIAGLGAVVFAVVFYETLSLATTRFFLGLSEVLSTGYGWIQQGLWGQLAHTPLIIILLLPFARILATSLSTSSSAGSATASTALSFALVRTRPPARSGPGSPWPTHGRPASPPWRRRSCPGRGRRPPRHSRGCGRQAS
ncbi:MAG TPA: hypothetical protein VK817_11695 [Trebonia sp.]|nr:hypothetical protein [Trebonia sp.]